MYQYFLHINLTLTNQVRQFSTVVSTVEREADVFVTTWVQFLASVVIPLYSSWAEETSSCPSRSRYIRYTLRQFLLYVFTQAIVDIKFEFEISLKVGRCLLRYIHTILTLLAICNIVV